MNEPQEGAQTAQQRIEDVLREHQWSFIKHGCRCEDPGTVSEWPAHAAAALVEALGLQSEYGVITDMGVNHPSLSRLSREGVQSLAAKYDDITPRTRLVTKWEQQA